MGVWPLGRTEILVRCLFPFGATGRYYLSFIPRCLPLLLFPDDFPPPFSHRTPSIRSCCSPTRRRCSSCPNPLRKKYGYQVTNVKRMNSKRANTAAIPITDGRRSQLLRHCEHWNSTAELQSCPDTGSSDLWVATTSCTSCGSDVPEFQTSKSSTYKATSSVLGIDYGSGSVQGTVAQDSVTFGSFEMSQEFLAVTSVTPGLIGDGLSGIMGLQCQQSL
ncbi:hypothetical protein P692DRAFT_201914550 [Suillus brevipes Sb2]|nr:hypothetical protein P692DRAFT_201914550 [Suillus brevipes Sb2]